MPARSAPRPVRRPRVSPVITLAAIYVHLLGQTAALVRADVTISTPTTGGQVGDGGTFTIAAAGSVRNDYGAAVTSTSGNEITTFTNLGGAFAYTSALFNDGPAMTALVNSGTMTGMSGIVTTGAIDTVSNAAGALIEAGDHGILVDGAGSGIGTLTNAGAITNTGGGKGVQVSGDGTVGTLANDVTGTITGGYNFGVYVEGSTVGSIVNAGTITGPDRAVLIDLASSLTSLTNSGTIQGVSVGFTAASSSSFGTITNAVGGLIRGDDAYGVQNALSVSGTIANAGSITAGQFAVMNDTGSLALVSNAGVLDGDLCGVQNNLGSIMSLTNATGGTIKGTAYDGVQNLGSLGSITNAGTIQGIGRAGIHNEDSRGAVAIGSIVNDAGGEITGGTGIFNDNTYGNNATITTITNDGMISGDNAALNNSRGTITTLTNRGSIASTGVLGDAVLNSGGATITTLANSGSITADGNGVLNAGTLSTLTNSGTIASTSIAGISNLGGDLGTLVNSGTISGTAGTAYGAIFAYGGTIGSIDNTGVIGDVRNESTIGTGSGTVISSTGAGAAIGAIYNQGVIDGSVTVDHQDLVVHGGPDLYNAGTFTGGVITVSDGSLTFADGFTFLGANVSLDAGAGTLTNGGTLFVDAPLILDGSLALAAGSTFATVVYDLTHFGSLAVSGDAAFDGTLDIEDFSISGLAAGDSYTLFSFARATGAFSGLAVNGTLLASLGTGQWAYGGLVLTEVWGANDFSLSIAAAVPEIDPAGIGSVLALLGGALSLLERTRFARSKRHAA